MAEACTRAHAHAHTQSHTRILCEWIILEGRFDFTYKYEKKEGKKEEKKRL